MDKSAVIIEEGVMYQGLKLLPLAVQVKEEETVITVKFNICVECYLLLRAERDNSGKHLPMEIFEREGLV
jgi:hypothetical protein